jgi:hypothetical protein
MKNWKGQFRKYFKGSFENSNEVCVPIKRDFFPILTSMSFSGGAVLQESRCLFK